MKSKQTSSGDISNTVSSVSRKQKFYPWLICLVSMLTILCTIGLVTIAFSTYLPYLRESLRLTNTQTSLINTVRALVSTVALLSTTRLYQKFSLRAGIVFSGFLLAGSCILFFAACSAKSLVLCYVAAVFMGLAYAYGSMMAVSLLIHNWFRDRQATAISLASMGSSIATAVLPPVITSLISKVGVGRVFLMEMFFILVCTAVVFLVVRDTPQQMGLHPLQTGKEVKTAKKKVTLSRGMSTGSVIMLYMIIFILGLVGTPFSSHMTVHFAAQGFEPMQIAAALSVCGVSMAVAKILFGMLSDRFGAYQVNYYYMGMYLLCALIMMQIRAGQNGMLFLASGLSGFGLMMGSLGYVIWCGNLSTEEEYARHMKMCQTVFSLGSLAGGPLPGIVADSTGSYAPAFAGYAVLILVSLILIQILYFRYTRRHSVQHLQRRSLRHRHGFS